MMGDLGHDLRTAWRGLLRTPLLSLAALLTLAVAIGGTTAVYALVDGVLLRGLPYAQSERLVALWVDYSEIADEVGLQDPRREWTNFDNWRDVREGARSLDDLAAFGGWTPTLVGDGDALRVEAASVTWNALSVLGVSPALGRGFVAADGAADAPATAVLTHGLWQRQFGGDPAVLGSTIELNRTSHTVIGLLPPGFRFPFLPEAELVSARVPATGDRGGAYIRQFGRLAAGVSLVQAQQELDTLAASLRVQHPDANRGLGLFVEPLQASLSRQVRPQLLVLQAAAVMVLLIAAANLASVMIARSQRRRGEFALRSALGASGMRQLRLLLAESVLLGLCGAALGLLLARFGVNGFLAMFPQGFGALWEISLDIRAALLAVLVAVAVAALLACAAHLSLRRIELREATSQGGSRIAGSRGGGRLGAGLVAFNFALALSVTVASLLLLGSHGRLQQADLGYRPEGVLAGNLALPAAAYPDEAALFAAYQRLREVLEAQPGLDAIGLSSSLPLGQGNTDTQVLIEGRPTSRPDGRAHVWFNRVSHDYLPTLGVRLREGRMFEPSDGLDGARRAMVNAAFVREYLDGIDPIGRRIGFGPADEPRWFDIIGVIDDVRMFNVATPQAPSLYIPLQVMAASNIFVSARTRGDALAALPALRSAVREFDPSLALADLRPMQQRVEAGLSLPRAVSRVSLLFAGSGLLLAGLGVYGTLAHSVLQRRREFGVRRALGADDGSVLGLVAGHAARPMLLGALLGVPLAWLIARQLQDVLYEVGLWSSGPWIGAFAVLLLVATAAAVGPWRSAVRVQPMEALRQE
jgi:putative ABC transport system permease protein